MKRKTPKVNYRELMPPDEGGSRPEEEAPPLEQGSEATQSPQTPAAALPKPPAMPAHPVETPVARKTPAADAPAPVSPPLPEDDELPPNRRRDRSRPLTPRELAAVLNENAPKAETRRPSASLSIERAAPDPNEPTPLPPEASGMIASDTMEFAVASAAALLPFRDRVKARQGSVDLLLFRIGHERFAADLAAVEEAVERGDIHGVPEAPPNLLGVADLRGRLMHVYSPEVALGVKLEPGASALLIVKAEGRRLALAVDDVDDVMSLPLDQLRDVPAGTDPDGVLLGVAWRADTLISLLDVESLTESLAAEPVTEPA